MWLGAPAVIASQLYGVETIPRMRHADLPNPLVAAYATRDRRLIYLAGIQTESHFENFCEVIGRRRPARPTHGSRQAPPGWRIGHALIVLLDEVFASRDLAEWVDALQALTTPWTVVQSAAEAAVDPQVVANGCCLR